MWLKSYKFSIIWALLIAVLCFLPGSNLPKTQITNIDLLVHFFFYSTFHFLVLFETVAYTHNPIQSKYLFQSFLVVITFGGIVELLQGTTLISRSSEWADFFANSFGAVIGWILFKWSYSPLKKYVSWKEKNTPKKI